MKWINVNEKYLDYLRKYENRIPRTDYGSNKYKPFFGILFETEDLSTAAWKICSNKYLYPNDRISQRSLDFKNLEKYAHEWAKLK